MAVEKEQLQEESVIRRFYQIILSWDYFALVKESKKRKKGTAESTLVRVKTQYKDVDDYIATYEPLIFEEAKSQIIKEKEEEEVTEWKLGVVKSWSEADDFHFIEFPCEIKEGESISQNDLLLLSKDKILDGKRLPTVYAFALVEQVRKFFETRLLRVRLYLAGEFSHFNTDNVQSCPRLLNMHTHICETQRQLYFMKMCSLSTIAREYVAIRTISCLPYKDLILNAVGENFGTEVEGWKIPIPLKEYVESTFNQYQHEAITAGLSSKAFVLIQGPPGTGKTQTILGILSTILHATPTRMHSKTYELRQGPQLPLEEKQRHWGLASPWLSGINPRDSLMPKDGDDGFFPTTGNELKPEAVTSSRKYRVRVLVCAPSNSALDEIVLRVLNGGVHDENDRAYCPKVVRIGLKAHHSIKAVSLDELEGSLTIKLMVLLTSTLEADVMHLKVMKQKRAGANKSATNKQSNGPAGSNDDSIRTAILDEATIVFSTLSFSGSHVFSKLNRRFDVVIIDEAAQAVEPATLVPLANQCKKVFLVGDPAQLPATVISDTAKNHGYGTSLFERLMQAGYPVKMLKTQYRMHPEIRSFPSKEFYEDSLEDGDDVKLRTKRSWHDYRCFGPFCFFDIHEGKEARPSGSGSWINAEEVDFVLFLYQKLITLYPTLKSGNQVAIISPYSQQVKLFQKRFEETFGMSAEKVVDICTVDGCQGREKDIAIFSCVRASKDKGIGFVEDIRRMNVGITRAKSAILVVGSASTLRRSGQWNKLVESAEKRNCFFKVSQPYSSFFSDESLSSMQTKVDEPSKVVGPAERVDNNDTQPDNATAAYNDQAQAEDNEYGEGGVDMDDGGFDED
ncbi:probable helicase MAGATAMA 3 isoform X1 [Cajanus cajan]|uniref:probable helicase MAGATAMA 3 isoform X1 n=1 Tax=Cajanus cajan TaxID=3821 RepID=UPI00098D82C2|nr:probable helicase MAGATAMA 3 isoform X1 [Cajanus cajan]XP_029130420.1 probable helicase MAGATAMA 3 isoform X1 [Cajanus cajan]